MKHTILLSFIVLTSSLALTAQNTNKAFAIVSNEIGKAGWMNIQEVDLSTGLITRTVFDKAKTPFILLDASTKTQIASHGPGLVTKNEMRYEHPTATMVAAAAYDQRHNKLFFTPMRFGELRWIDLSEKNDVLKVYCLTDQTFFFAEANNEAANVTRMVIASDGNGYALSNDANHFVRFTTGKKPSVTYLGMLQDDEENAVTSIHNKSAWGGDMIADATGNLYVIAANHSVYKVDVRKRIAMHLGSIEGLPEKYTTNGAAIDKDGNLIVSSALAVDGYYTCDLTTLKAKKHEAQNLVFSSSDLASGNLAFQKQLDDFSKAPDQSVTLNFPQNRVSLYPNPVSHGRFKLYFQTSQKGQYDIQVVALSGKVISQRRVTIGVGGQTENIIMDSKLAKGLYIVKLLNPSKKLMSSGKIIFQ
ncbi:MAG: T9SS type A sorting domain-containing protein [Chitinophagaceae bacterium]